jgi:aminopeptidase N
MNLLNPNNYQKGAWVLHMLRSSLGDEVFFRGIRDYYHAHEDRTANTEDLRAALEKASGKDLKDFFQRWVYGVGHPKYNVSIEFVPQGELRVILRQVQPGDAFRDPIPIVVATADGKQSIVVTPNGKEAIATIKVTDRVMRNPIRGVDVQVDPNNTLLKEVTTK